MTFRARACAGALVYLLVHAARPMNVGAQAPTVDQIVARFLEAKGGADKLRAINTVKMTARVKSPAGESQLTVWAKRPNMMRRETSREGQRVVVAFDGTTVWALNSMMGPAPQQITGPPADMTRQDAADFDSVLLDYKQKGYTVELVGTEPVDGLPAYHLKITKPGGRVQHLYLNTETMLESRVSMELDQMGKKMTASIDFSNYKAVDGVMVPFRVRQSNNGTVAGELSYSQIQFNVPIEASFFAMPAR